MLHWRLMRLRSCIRVVAVGACLLGACGLSAKPTVPALPPLDAAREQASAEAPTVTVDAGAIDADGVLR